MIEPHAMRTPSTIRPVFLFFVGFVLTTASVRSQVSDETFLSSFEAGREYFTLRSGTAKLIIEADKHGTQPAFTYMLFDANKPCQTLRKERAFNYARGKGCSSSALALVLGGSTFTALAHTTNVRWVDHEGVPSVEARWWAGGIAVTEIITPLVGAHAFLRQIILNGKDLAGQDSVRLRLSLPAGTMYPAPSTLISIVGNAAIGIHFLRQPRVIVNVDRGCIESMPIGVGPHDSVLITTVIMTRIPAQGYLYDRTCTEDQPIPSVCLESEWNGVQRKGLKGEYFDKSDLRGSPTVVRLDTTLSPYWDTGSPADGIRPDSFSVRWTGFILPPRSGTYRFSLVADDRARLFIHDSLLIDAWTDSWNAPRNSETQLRAGMRSSIRVEYGEATGWAGMRCRWSVPMPPPESSAVLAGIQEMVEAFRELDARGTEHELASSRTEWRSASTIRTPDLLVQDLFDHARYALPGMVGPNGTMDAGIFEYGNQWVRDGSNVALGLIHAGHFEAAHALLRFIVTDLVSAEGTTVVSGGFDDPDREEFDQMGELVHVLKAYRDWTGDSSMIINARAKLIAMIERPLRPAFRDSTGMVHNRREFWERTFNDGYELAYQTLMVRGLRDAADLSGMLGVPEKEIKWRDQADEFLRAMLHHPSHSLVEHGTLIKRRNRDGSVAAMIPGPESVSGKDDPVSTEAHHRLNPDASAAIPIFLRVIDPHSALARSTLDALESIWNGRWDAGGYERYHSSSQQDQPGPWSFATTFLARAQHDAGLYQRSRRSLEWLLHVQGGNAGAWFEEIPLIRSQIATSGIVPWTSAEIPVFTLRHWLGVSFEGRDLVLHPNLFPHQGGVTADLRFRSSRIRLTVDGPGAMGYALVNSRKLIPRKDGSFVIPENDLRGNLNIMLFGNGGQK
jgi:hypothetical protein